MAVARYKVKQRALSVQDLHLTRLMTEVGTWLTMREVGLTILLLTLSNVLMTFAWYARLKELGSKPWVVAVLISWGVGCNQGRDIYE